MHRSLKSNNPGQHRSPPPFRQELIILAYVYKIINDVNDKVYIGLTFDTLENRWKNHVHDKNAWESRNRPLYRAMNKYGIEHFHMEEIEQCDDLVVNEREQYWIQYYDSYHNGYNATLGGEGSVKYNREEIYKLFQEGHTIQDICNILGCDKDVPHTVLIAKGIDIVAVHSQRCRDLYGKKCKCISKDGSVTKTFATLTDGARYVIEQGFSHDTPSGAQTHIGQVFNGKRKSAYGFYWEYI